LLLVLTVGAAVEVASVAVGLTDPIDVPVTLTVPSGVAPCAGEVACGVEVVTVDVAWLTTHDWSAPAVTKKGADWKTRTPWLEAMVAARVYVVFGGRVRDWIGKSC